MTIIKVQKKDKTSGRILPASFMKIFETKTIKK